MLLLTLSLIRPFWFSEGLASVQVGEKSRFIDKTGKYVINPQFDGAGLFRDGVAMVAIKGLEGKSLMGYIDKTGKYVFGPTQAAEAPPRVRRQTVRVVGEWAGG